jgi:hypothetical protein
MSKPCKAILIDPAEATIRQVDYDGDIQTIYRLLSSPWQRVGTFEAVRINDKDDVVYIDENGLLHDPMVPHWFAWEGYAQPLAGRGLILGTDDEGNSIAPQIGVGEVNKRVTNLARIGDMLIGLKDKQVVGYKVPRPHAEVIFPYPVPKRDQN